MSLILSGTDGLSDVDGTAATPALRGTDANTGIFFPAADTIAFAEGGAECARFNSSGNLGIGNTSPSYQLSLSKAGATYIEIKDTSGGVTSYLGASTDQLYIGNSTNHAAVFYTNNAERMRINAGAPILCLSGGSTTATGTGIAFPATQSASSDANTLDDYEEGTATITLTAATGSIALLGGYDTLRYTKVGRLVTISGRLYVNSVSSPTGTLTLTGLPFTSSSAAAAETSFSVHALGLNSSATTAVQAFIGTSATIITISNYRAGTDDTLGSYVQANTQFRINGTYSV